MEYMNPYNMCIFVMWLFASVYGQAFAYPVTLQMDTGGLLHCSLTETGLSLCSWPRHLYSTSDMKYRNNENSDIDIPMGMIPIANYHVTMPDSLARFNIHLYLDHMWHLNIGFSR